MARQSFKDTIRFFKGFILSRPKIDANTDYAARGSSNILFTGQAKPRPFKGLQLAGGVGGIYGVPIGGGQAGFTNLRPGEDLSALTFTTICGTGDFAIGSYVNNEVTYTNVNAAQSEGGYSTVTVTTDATIEFRFPTLLASAVVGLRYSPAQDCALIQDSLLDRGWEMFVSAAAGGVVTFTARENSGVSALASHLYAEAWDADTVYRITLRDSVARFYSDGLLKATGPDNADGTPLALFVRVDGSAGNHGSVTMRIFANQ